MKQYSIEAVAAQPVAVPEPLILLDKGFNVFTILTDDIDGVLDLLKGEGVTISKTHLLSQDEAPSLEHELLPGETRESIGLL